MKIYYLRKNKNTCDICLEIRQNGNTYRSTVQANVSPYSAYQTMQNIINEHKKHYVIGITKDLNIYSPWYPVVYMVK